MSYNLWIDDQSYDPDTPDRHPPENMPEQEWTVATSSHEAMAIIDEFGPPKFMDLDHDLGEYPDGTTDTVKVFLKYLFEKFPHAKILYNVHSQNPEGVKWIHSYMGSWRRSLELP